MKKNNSKKNLKGGMLLVGPEELAQSFPNADIDVECTYPVEKSDAWTDSFGPRKKFNSHISSGSIEHMGRKDDTCWLDRNPAPEFLNASVKGADGGRYLNIFDSANKDDKIILDWFKFEKGNKNKKKFHDITELKSNFVIRLFRGDTNEDLITDNFFVVDETFGIVYDIISIKDKSNNEVVAGIDGQRFVDTVIDTSGKFDWKNKIVTVGNFVGTVNDDNPNIFVPVHWSWQFERMMMPWNVNIDGYSDERTIGQLITKNEIWTQVEVQLEYLRKIYELTLAGIKVALPTSAFMREK